MWGEICICSAPKNVKEQQSEQRQDKSDTQKIGHTEQPQLCKHTFDDPDQHRKPCNFTT
jgi:hypothetical protein